MRGENDFLKKLHLQIKVDQLRVSNNFHSEKVNNHYKVVVAQSQNNVHQHRLNLNNKKKLYLKVQNTKMKSC